MAKRVTSIGGQALLEGILMVGPKKNVAAFCDEAGNITTEEVSTPSLREKYPILKKPFIRGVFSMVDTLRLGMKALTLSADKVGGEEEEEPSKFEKWLEKKFGDKVMNAVVAVGGVLGVALAVLLFFFLPAVLFNGLMMLTGDGISGCVRCLRAFYVSSFLYCTLLSSLKCRRLTAHSATTARSTRRFSAMKTTCRSPWKMCGSKSASTRAAAPVL